MTSFEEKVKKFNSFYLWLIISVGALSAAAILTAVYFEVYVGIIIGICAAVSYTATLGYELRTSLGFKYTRISGGIALSAVEPKRDAESSSAERHIPSRLMWLDVVALTPPEKNAPADTLAETVYIPVSVKKIEQGALSAMPSLCRIVYLGSYDEWCEIDTCEELSAYELVCTEGEDNYNLQEDDENEIS